MTPSALRRTVVVERVAWIRRMLEGIRSLPMENLETFLEDPRNAAAAESFLRRALEALLDLGRHLLAKGFAIAVTEYKDIGRELQKLQILEAEEAHQLKQLAGYQNRLVHFYHEVTVEELYEICTQHLSDVERLLDRLLRWIQEHPEKMDATL